MKNLWKITFIAATLTLFACGGNTKTNVTDDPNKQETQTTTEEVFSLDRAAESEVAYEALNLMLKQGLDGSDEAMAQLLEGRKSYNGVSELKFDLPVPTDGNGTYYQCADDYDDVWTVKCYPRRKGGWTVLAGVDYILGDWGPSQYFAYNYVDGKLTLAMELLPRPKFNDIYNAPEMLNGLSEERIAWLREVMDGEDNEPGVLSFDNDVYYFDIYDAPFLVLLGSQIIAMNDAYFDRNDFHFAKTVFFWNGECFEQVCPVEGFAYGDCTEGDEYSYIWSEEEGHFVPYDC